MRQYIVGLFLFLIMFSSCEKKDYLDRGIGYLYIHASNNVDVITKAVTDTEIDSISIAICKAATGDTAKFFGNYAADLGDNKVQLPAGKYYVKAGTVHSGKAAFDKPFYFGVDTIDVVKATIKESEVVCTLANVKVTVNYSDLLKKFFTEYKATISNVSGELTFEEDEKRAGYFTPDKLNVVLNLVNNDGTPYQIVKEISNVKAREHYRLFFSIGEEPESPEAGGNFDVTVNEETNDIECTLKVPVFTDEYGRNIPKIITDPELLNGILSVKETNPGGAFLTTQITSKLGLKLTALKLSSTYFNEVNGLPDYIDLSNDALQSQLEAIGIGLEGLESDNPQEVKIDFTNLLSKLPLLDGKKTTHSIIAIARDIYGQQVEDTFNLEIRPNVAVEVNVGTWSTFAYLSAKAGTSDNLSILYKEDGGQDWIDVVIDPIDIKQTSDGDYTFSAKINGLTKNSKYQYKVIADKDDVEGTFVTGDEEQILCSNFDLWHMEGKAYYVGKSGERIWDSGNEGGASFGFNPTTEENTDVVKGSAARLASTYALVKFAAGNLFTGDFVGLYNTTQAKLDFGIPYVCKPTTLKGYYKYIPGKIDRGDYLGLNGKTDSCHIYIALCDWTAPFRVMTGDNQFVDLSTNNNSILAFGEIKDNKKMEKYEQFKIKLKYRDKFRQPTYILIVASASKYGDYFTGSTSSVLLIDEFELGFEEPVNLD